MHRGAAGATEPSPGHLRVIGTAVFEKRGELVLWLQADRYVEISDHLIEQADDRYLSAGDGIVTFHCANGDLSYGLLHHDDLRETWIAVRSDLADEDD